MNGCYANDDFSDKGDISINDYLLTFFGKS
jgi:hypothetical protein